MDPWFPAAAAALGLALLLPDRSTALRRLRGPGHTRGGRWPWRSLLRPVRGAPGRETRARIAITAGGAAAVLALAAGSPGLTPLVTALCGAGAYVGSGRVVSPGERRRRERLRAELPGALDLMALCLAAGLPVRGAAAAVAGVHGGPLAEDVGGVLAQVAIGDAESRAWLRLADDPVWDVIARDLARSVESGTALVELLQTHADRARRERRAAVVARARTVGVRSVLPLMTCYLPAFMLVGIVPVVAGAVPRLLG